MLRRLKNVFNPFLNKSIYPRFWADSTSFENNKHSKEVQISDQLKKTIAGITFISVEDISGGCGAMYEINIQAREFKGLSRVRQHRLVTESLKEEISQMHGVRIHTQIPDENS